MIVSPCSHVDHLRYKNTNTMESRLIQTFVKTCGCGSCRRQGGHAALAELWWTRKVVEIRCDVFHCMRLTDGDIMRCIVGFHKAFSACGRRV